MVSNKEAFKTEKVKLLLAYIFILLIITGLFLPDNFIKTLSQRSEPLESLCIFQARSLEPHRLGYSVLGFLLSLLILFNGEAEVKILLIGSATRNT